MIEKNTFKDFLSRNWWILFIAFIKAFNQAEEESVSGYLFLDLLFFGVIIIAIMFIYWFIRYGLKQNK